MAPSSSQEVSWFLTITRRLVDNDVVLKAAGRLGSAGAPELASALLNAAEESGDEKRQVVLDLTDVDYISSAGLEAIERAAASLRTRSATLCLRGADGATKLSLDLVGRLPNVSYCA